MEDDNTDPDKTDLDGFEEFVEYRNSDRKRGILTKNDRGYLLGELELSGQDERNTRYRIRQRLIQSFMDLRLISREYPEEELEKLMGHDHLSERDTALAMVDLASTMCHLSRFTATADEPLDFEQIIEQAVVRQHLERVEAPEGFEGIQEVEAEVNISVSVSQGEVQDLVDTLVAEADKGLWAAFARRANFDEGESGDDVKQVAYQPLGVDEHIIVPESIAEMIKRSEERRKKE
jgi:hypothetical protein